MKSFHLVDFKLKTFILGIITVILIFGLTFFSSSVMVQITEEVNMLPKLTYTEIKVPKKISEPTTISETETETQVEITTEAETETSITETSATTIIETSIEETTTIMEEVIIETTVSVTEIETTTTAAAVSETEAVVETTEIQTTEAEIVQLDLYIEAIGLNSNLKYSENPQEWQSIVDDINYACYFPLNGNYYIADHNGQGFYRICYAAKGMIAKVYNDYYVCDRVALNGTNEGTYLAINGESINNLYEDCLIIYTCNDPDGYSITITIWKML